LTGYFAGAGSGGPTTCPEIVPGSLTAEQEQQLIVRFVRLAPLERCIDTIDGIRDAITGGTAQVVQIYGFACPSTDRCSGWVTISGASATRYAMRFENGAWRFDADRRIVAE